MRKTGIIEGMCPRCGEYTEVSFEDNGCCDRGAESEGHVYTYEDFEEEPIVTNDIKEGNTNETNNIKDLFNQCEVFSLPVSRLHKVYLTPETHLTFNNFTNALNAYGQSRSRVLIEDLGISGYLVYHRDLTDNPVKATSLNEALKIVERLL